ncbi:hypothetical protein ACUXPM_005739, partial [Ralstonia sp. 151470066-2]
FGGKALARHLGLLLARVEFSLSTWTRNNRSRHASNPGRPYRKVHDALANAVRVGQRIVLTYLQNPADGESLDELERRLIREHDSFGPLAHQLNGTL